MTIRRAVTEDGNTADGVRKALLTAVDEAGKAGADILVFTPVKSQLEHGILVDVFGPAVCKALLKGKKVPTNAGPPYLRHVTERTFSGYGQTGEVVLACWLDKKALDSLDGTKPPAIVYVAWHPDHGNEWLDQWGMAEDSPQEALSLDPVVKRALDSLSGSVNLSTGLSHPRDKKAAKDTFLILVRAGYALSRDQVHQYGLQKGWQPADARKLAALAESVVEGKYANEPVETWRPDILDYWKGND